MKSGLPAQSQEQKKSVVSGKTNDIELEYRFHDTYSNKFTKQNIVQIHFIVP